MNFEACFMSDTTTERACNFSPCRTWRYRLDIRWKKGRCLNWLMLNPSTADEIANDPTVERCERRARQWGYGRVIVTNLFGYRATSPKRLREVDDPIGPENDEYIVEAAQEADRVVVAWGNHGLLNGRSDAVRELLAEHNIRLHALRIAKTGEPVHPLYVAYAVKPQRYRHVPPA